MRFGLVGLTLLFLTQTAAAMSFQAAGENLLYFEHARLSTEFCEQRGFSVRSSYEDWRRRNNALHREATDAVRFEATARGLRQPERESLLAEAFDNHRRLAQDHISKNGVNCSGFAQVLDMYSSLFKR